MKKITIMLSALCLAAGLPSTVKAQAPELTLDATTPDMSENEPRPVFPVPSERQLKWNQTEFYAFFHYGMNTYTDEEWGSGAEDESKFAPTQAPNPKQWLQAIKDGGMKGGIAVVKHHDGFCLWPTATTEHSVKNAGNQFGKDTNIPRDFAKAAQELGLKYGFYISPWDLSSKWWGLKGTDGFYTDDYAKKVFLPQCEEIAKYGADQFEMWFDGATGGDHAGYYGGDYNNPEETDKNGNVVKKTGYRTIDNANRYYDIPNLRDKIHQMCPNIILWGVGGEARWIGNEAGWAGETCWSMGDGTSGNETAWKWFPGESDAKATSKGWFYHDGETCFTAAKMFTTYLKTVGRNATLILNFPPNKAGVLPDADVKNLKELGQMLKDRLGNDFARETGVKIEATATRADGATKTYKADNMIDGNIDTYWAAPDGKTSDITITVTLPQEKTLHYVMMQEYIQLGQRIKGFTIETSTDGNTWTRKASNIQTTTVGYKRIIPLNGNVDNSYDAGTKAKYVRIKITDSRACPTLHTLSIF